MRNDRRYMVGLVGWLCVAVACVAGPAWAQSVPAAGQTGASGAAVWTAALNTATQLEAQCQTEVQGQASPEEAGRIYAQVAEAYWWCGVAGLDKVAEYCQKGLDCPQDALTKAKLYAWWGDTIYYRPSAGVIPSAETRQQAVTKYLQALGAALTGLTAEKAQPLPTARTITAGQDLTAARQAVILQNNLVSCRDAMIQRVAGIYIESGAGRDELQSLATQVLANADAVQKVLAGYDRIMRR